MVQDSPNLSEDNLEFFASHWPRVQSNVYGYIFSLLHRHHDVDDVMQEVAIAVCRNLGQFDREREFLPWVLAIARVRSIDYLRKNNRSRLVLSDEALKAVEAPFSKVSFDDVERREALSTCISRLQPRAAAIVQMRYASGFSVQDIAKRLGNTPNAISVLLYRSRDALADCVRRLLREEG